MTELDRLFEELCRIESPTGRERACQDRVIAELTALGLDPVEDDAAERAGLGAGNVLARIAGRAEPSILLCAHVDTVPLAAPVDPVLDDGVWRNRNAAILGADNKAALAVILQAARRWAADPPPVGIELLFTAAEEHALLGATAFDASVLRSRCGWVLDHATPIGEVIVASPTYHRIDAHFTGVAAHAGYLPERGRSAIAAAASAIAGMRLGRLDASTTANVGHIVGGLAGSTNVVPDACSVLAEARSFDDARVEAVVGEIVDRLEDGASEHGCDVDIDLRRMFSCYRLTPADPELVIAEAALEACGHVPVRVKSGGGSDANALRAQGFPCGNLANGTEFPHHPDEQVTSVALEQMLEIVLELPAAAARVLA